MIRIFGHLPFVLIVHPYATLWEKIPTFPEMLPVLSFRRQKYSKICVFYLSRHGFVTGFFMPASQCAANKEKWLF